MVPRDVTQINPYPIEIAMVLSGFAKPVPTKMPSGNRTETVTVLAPIPAV
jgi:hypothetical protein